MATPNAKKKITTLLGDTINDDMKEKLKDFTFQDMRSLKRAFDTLPPGKKKIAKPMCCCTKK